jgi:hypothetical protein
MRPAGQLGLAEYPASEGGSPAKLACSNKQDWSGPRKLRAVVDLEKWHSTLW